MSGYLAELDDAGEKGKVVILFSKCARGPNLANPNALWSHWTDTLAIAAAAVGARLELIDLAVNLLHCVKKGDNTPESKSKNKGGCLVLKSSERHASM